ncbi:putative leucine-rich repeat-containing, plant-type, leucine-rich repeat domain superfamily [Helianthus debilis subsp. tardiflorus]
MNTHLCFHIFFIPFYLILLPVSGQCQNDQRSILIQLKKTLHFDSTVSTKLVSWKPNDVDDCCKWEGVTCSPSGQIIGLDLSNETISSGIDDSSVLFSLKNLERVNLAANSFKFIQIPSRFGSLASLSYLNLSNSGFTGQIPGELSQLNRLEVLDLSSYISLLIHPLKLENPNLDTLVRNLTRLKCLYLDNVNISSQKSDWCQSLSSYLLDLEVLSLSNCQLSGPLDDSLEKLRSLSVINLALNNLSATVPDFFANFKNLTVMKLGSCNLIGTFPEKVLQLQSLQILDLSANRNLSGSLPNFPVNGSLRSLVLSHTSFSGEIPESIGNLKNLSTIDLMGSKFNGKIPESVEKLTQLVSLDLSLNNFIGQIPTFQKCKNLTNVKLSRNGLSEFQDRLSNLRTLDLSFNNLSIITSDDISLVSNLPKFSSLKLASCELHKFPNLRNQTRLQYLDLSNNVIEGNIPTWIWEVGNGSLSYMNLSHNRLTGLQEHYNFHNLNVLDLHSNHLSGEIPVPPQSATIIDYSNNLFNSSLPESIGRNLSRAYFFSFSNSLLTGVIPETICNASYLKVLDLSNNRLNGSIPKCLIESGSIRLGVLNLGNNSLSGQIKGTFPRNCQLNTLDLHGNGIKGKIPESLVNCTMLEVLNLGKNNINDTYPWFLGNDTNLRVLVLRSNNLHGSVRCSQDQHNNWSKLQILDIACNNLSGAISEDCFLQWGAMMIDEDGDPPKHKHLSFKVLQFDDIYYQDTVTVTAKGLEMELTKILTLFTSIDISSNRFSGEIPSTIGRLKALYVLNVSRNEFTGSIPPSIGNLTQLESLDMSRNNLAGEIPYALINLNFLSVFNLSYNQLRGRIPTGKQFQTFENDSYLGNMGLCGFPLIRKCSSSNTSNTPETKYAAEVRESKNGYDWQFILTGAGYGAGAAVVLGTLMLSKTWRHLWHSYTNELVKLICLALKIRYAPYGLFEEDEDVDEKETLDGDESSNESELESEVDQSKGRYCVFCTKLDIYRKQAIHDPNCTCFDQTKPLSRFSSICSSEADSPFTRL